MRDYKRRAGGYLQGDPSGWPTSRPPGYSSPMKANRPMDEMAREHAARAIDVIANIMDSDMSEDKDRIRAAETILDRGYGKAAQAIIQMPASRKQEAILAALSDEQLVAIIEQKKLPRLNPPQPLITVEHPRTGEVLHRRRQRASPHGPAAEVYADPIIDPLLL
jgi:hypothetical protein